LTPLNDILSGHVKSGTEPTASSAAPNPQNAFLGFVKDSASTPPSTVISPQSANAFPVMAEPVFSMIVLGPNDRKRYDWSDLKQLPVETVVSTAGGGSSPPPLPALSHAVPTGSGSSDQPGAGSSGDEGKAPPKDGKE
jgi:hypothetical protein